jgi:hypothetical protein
LTAQYLVERGRRAQARGRLAAVDELSGAHDDAPRRMG